MVTYKRQPTRQEAGGQRQLVSALASNGYTTSTETVCERPPSCSTSGNLGDKFQVIDGRSSPIEPDQVRFLFRVHRGIPGIRRMLAGRDRLWESMVLIRNAGYADGAETAPCLFCWRGAMPSLSHAHNNIARVSVSSAKSAFRNRSNSPKETLDRCVSWIDPGFLRLHRFPEIPRRTFS